MFAIQIPIVLLYIENFYLVRKFQVPQEKSQVFNVEFISDYHLSSKIFFNIYLKTY